MKIIVHFWVSALVLIACNSNPKTPSSPATSSGTDKTEVLPVTPIYYPCAGIIFGQGVRLRQDSLPDSPETGHVSTGDMLEIQGVTLKRYTPAKVGSAACPMVKVKTESGKKGWIFGKFVFRILEKDTRVSSLPPFEWAGETYKFTLCRNYTIGAFDGEGLTGDDEFYPVLLTNTKNLRNYPVSLYDSQKPIEKFKYWNLEADEGYNEVIKHVKVEDNDRLRIDIQAQPMEGCRRYQIDIVRKADVFIGTCSHEQIVQDGYCE